MVGPSALTRKLLRDLWGLRGQTAATAAVVAGGVATWVISFSVIASLQATQRAFYRDYAFADVFAHVTRAPDDLAARAAQLDGVRRVESRIVGQARLQIAGFDDPVTARLVSLPDHGNAPLNRVYLRRGALPAPGASTQVVISEPFAEAHGLQPGDRLPATINGRRRTLTISGIGLSPEYVYQIQPGSLFPDYARYAIAWMRRPTLEAAYDMDGAFNDLTLTLAPGTAAVNVIPALDRLLQPYGGIGAYDRSDQTSNEYVSNEIRELRSTALVVPLLFLGVAAFLLNVVITRTVHRQREQIAILKAFGYGNAVIGRHYAFLVALMVLAGAIPGVLLGAWAGHGMASLYREFFRFPYLAYRLPPATVLGGVGVALLAALAGTLRALWHAVRVPPAEAMRPEPPAHYRATVIERLGLQRWLDQPTRMILRHLERRPLNAVLSVLGIALAGGILTVGNFQEDAVNYMMDVQYGLASREDLTVTFTDPAARSALFELQALPGVRGVEPFRAVGAELVHGPRRYRTSIQGYPDNAQLHRALDRGLDPIRLPAAGMLLSAWLGRELGVGVGDTITVELLDGSGDVRRVPVAGLVHDFIGVSGYMRLDALNTLLDEGSVASGAYLAVAPGRLQSVFTALQRRPRVAAVSRRTAARDAFLETMGRTLLIFAFVNTLLAGSIALGVVYNSARIGLAERARELGSLRILGFTRGETAYILLGELALLTLAAIPVAGAIGWGFCYLIARGLSTELFRVPLVIEPGTYAFAAIVILVAAILSAVAVGRRLFRMDLVSVLKVRE